MNAGEPNIFGFKSLIVQPYLFDEPLRGHGHARTIVGDLAERLTARLTGGRRHRTDGRASYCPDVSAGDEYYESKAVGRSRTAFIYGGRLAKDREFALAHNLRYVIWHHRADTKLVETVGQLEAMVIEKLVCAYAVPFEEIDWLCAWLQPEPLNSKYGGSLGRPEYGSGYRIKLSALEQWRIKCPPGSIPEPGDANCGFAPFS